MIRDGATYAYVEGDVMVIPDYYNYIFSGTDIVDPEEINPRPSGYVTGGPAPDAALESAYIKQSVWGAGSCIMTIRSTTPPATESADELAVYLGWEGAPVHFRVFNGIAKRVKVVAESVVNEGEEGEQRTYRLQISATGLLPNFLGEQTHIDHEYVEGTGISAVLQEMLVDCGYTGQFSFRANDRELEGTEKIKIDTSNPLSALVKMANLARGGLVFEDGWGLSVVNTETLLNGPVQLAFEEGYVLSTDYGENRMSFSDKVRMKGGSDLSSGLVTLGPLRKTVEYHNEYLMTGADRDEVADEVKQVSDMKSSENTSRVVGCAFIQPGMKVRVTTDEATSEFFEGVVTSLQHRYRDGIRFETQFMTYSE